MDKLQIILVKLVQLFFAGFYIYIGLVFVGMLLLVPLGALYHIYKLFDLIIPTALASVLAVAVVGYCGYTFSKMPELVEFIKAAGCKFMELAKSQYAELGTIAKRFQQAP
jgi:hypothetical protein